MRRAATSIKGWTSLIRWFKSIFWKLGGGPGGRIAISGIVLTENIDPELRQRFQATWAGCLGGAIAEQEYLQKVRNAGFTEIQVVARHLLTPVELTAMVCCPGEELTPRAAQRRHSRSRGKSEQHQVQGH